MATMNQVFSAYNARQSLHSLHPHSFSAGIAYVAGTYSPIFSARIPLLDQGFLRSDLAYDVPSVWDGQFFRLDDHLTRLEASCAKIRLKLPLPKDEVKRVLLEMVGKSGCRDAYVSVIVTRGLKGLRGSGSKIEEIVNRLYMFVVPYVWVMEPEVQVTGGTAVIARSVRRIEPAAIDPTVKNLQWGDFTTGLWEARDRGAVYPFLLDGEGNLTEGAGYNIVLVKKGVLYTPERGVLEGVTRRSVVEIAETLGIEVVLGMVREEMAYESEEIFMCTTAGGIMPITKLDGKVVGEGVVGPITGRIWDAYWKLHYDSRYTIEVKYEDAGAARPKL